MLLIPFVLPQSNSIALPNGKFPEKPPLLILQDGLQNAKGK